MKINKVFNVDSNIDISSIMYDSRIAMDNSIFFAIKGKINDGHKFIDTAISNGAKCIVYSDEIINKQEGIVYIQSDDVMHEYVKFCNCYYDYPTDKLKCIAVTGTNGKTTISWIIRGLISHFSKCGYIGTMGYYCGDVMEDSSLNLTTPKSDELFRICKKMVDNNCKYLALEASSEGLSTHRLDDVKFEVGVFTNLSSEHMDVHNDMESYFKAKCILFDRLDETSVAVINTDDQYGKRLFNLCKARKVSYGIDEAADYKASNVSLFNDHSEFDLIHNNLSYHIVTNMVAKFNIYNLLAVIATLNEIGFKIENIIDLLKDVELCPGRCQLVKAGQDFNVVVDYAFTPNSFEKVFAYANSITDNNHNIFAVFGAAGDRDHGRRPGSVRVADKYAKHVILSYDDPASENMMDICMDLKSYFKNIEPEIILDRYEAIKKVISMANKGDTILLLGKGNDEFFLDKKGRIPWMSDEKAAIKAINELNLAS